MIKTFGTIILGKTTNLICKIRGGGSALPGLIIEKVNPDILKNTLSELPYGVVVVSGTNGKTTTTKIITELLQAQGLKVFTNDSGSNFVRGILASLVDKIKFSGKFDYDIAVLELDEAHSKKFAEIIPINYSVLLNVSEDQLDRFGSTKNIAELLISLAQKTKKATIINREDPLLSTFESPNQSLDIRYFGLNKKLRTTFLTEDQSTLRQNNLDSIVTLEKYAEKRAVFRINHKNYSVDLHLKGNYNALNSAAALTLVKTIFPDTDDQALVSTLANISSARGRGEKYLYHGQEFELFLIKNPASFQLSIASFANDKYDYLVAINNHVADGIDISWLDKVNFRPLKTVAVVGGECAIRLVTYLKKDHVKAKYIELNLHKALNKLVASSKKPKRIFANYTAMAEILKILKKPISE